MKATLPVRLQYALQQLEGKQLTPYEKFRLFARAVRHLIHVCKVCKSIVQDSVEGQDWYIKVMSWLESSDGLLMHNGELGDTEFVGYVRDDDQTLTKVTFDRNDFARKKRTEQLLSPEIISILKKKGRSNEEDHEILRFMKRAVPAFNSYDIRAQRELINCMVLVKYEKSRVIYKEKNMADCVYFVLSGTLVEKASGKKHLRDISSGNLFGREDIVCGCPRRHTVLTTSEVQLLCIHRLDYRVIVNMADDSFNPRYLDICRHDIVFQHFPMKKLVGNSGVWTVMGYKYGRLMAEDSNKTDWIYIIRSGEAKVMKYLHHRSVNLMERRRILSLKQQVDDPYYQKLELIEFLADTNMMTSTVNQPTTAVTFQPLSESTPRSEGTKHARRLIQSAPSRHMSSRTVLSPDRLAPGRQEPVRHARPFTTKARVRFTTGSDTSQKRPLPASLRRILGNKDDSSFIEECVNNTRQDLIENSENKTDNHSKDENIQRKDESTKDKGYETTATDTDTIIDSEREAEGNERDADSEVRTDVHDKTVDVKPEVLKIPSPDENCPPIMDGCAQTKMKSPANREPARSNMINIPPFVQLDTLYPGRVFGLRSCLNEDEQGASASLVSGGCEVLLINKKFFMQHLDEAIIGLIKLKHTSYPSEEELLDRLDANFQWEEYKQETVNNFLIQKGRVDRQTNKAVKLELRPT